MNIVFSEGTKVIDLGNDFRLNKDKNLSKTGILCMGCLNCKKKKIIEATNIANPGCFATAIQLALLPLASIDQLNTAVHINATTGSTGAGVIPGSTTHFSWRDNNFSSYKVFTHQHLDEIQESIVQFATQF